MDESRIKRLLEPFRLDLDTRQLGQITTYLDLLLRWNRAVNLTAIREPDQIVTRHFGESMYLKGFRQLRGTLLDVGSGAGFPGLAMKIAEPGLHAVLLEPVGKKRAFLKEILRECCLDQVEVLGERIDQFCAGRRVAADIITARAVGGFGRVLSSAVDCLAPEDGELCLWLTRREAAALSKKHGSLMEKFQWRTPIPIPLSHEREIWCGTAVPRETSGANGNRPT